MGGASCSSLDKGDNAQKVQMPAQAEPVVQSLGGARCLKDVVVTTEFKESMKSQKPLHAPGVLSKDSVGDLDEVLEALVKASEVGNCAAYKNGDPCMRSSIFLAYLDQATLTLTEAEKFVPRLLELCQSLYPCFDYVSSRLVIDPPGARVPPLQTDSDMIALQLWGDRQLKICRPVAGLPVTAKRPGPLLTPLMQAGDALYVPSGLEVRFEGDTSGQEPKPTMYVVVSVRTHEQKLGVSLGKHLTELLMDPSLSKETNAFLRTAATKRTLGPHRRDINDSEEAMAERRSKIEAGMRAAVAEIREKVTASSLKERQAKRMEQLRNEQLDGAKKITQQRLPDESMVVTEKSYVRVARGVQCSCNPGDSKAFFKRGTETLPLDISPSASYMIAELTDGAPRAMSSLSCSDPLERICVAQILVFKECFEIHRER